MIRSWADVLEVVLLHFWRALAVGLGVCAAAAYLLLSGPDVYEARSLLLFQLGRDYIYVPDASSSGIRAPDPGSLQLYLNAEIQILDSTPLRQALVEKLGAATIYPELAGDPDAVMKAETALRSDISIKLIAGSYIVDIRVRHVEPERAAQIARALVATYMQRRTQVLGAESPAFVQNEIAQAETRLRDVEASIRDQLGGHDIAFWDAAQEAARSAQVTTSQTLASVRSEIAALSETERLLAAELEAIAPENRVAGNAAFDRTEPGLRSARLALAQAQARMQSLATDLATNGVILSQYAAVSDVIERSRGQLATERDNLNHLQARLRESEVSQARMQAGSGSVRVIEAATVGENPVGAPKKIRAIGAVIIGIIAAAIYVLGEYLRRPLVLTANILQARLGLAIQGEIEDRGTARMRRYVRREDRLLRNPNKPRRSERLLAGGALRPAVRRDELFGAVQALVRLWQTHQRPLIVQVCGPVGGEGVSSVASALAEVVSRERPTGVLLIALDDVDEAGAGDVRQVVDHMTEQANQHVATIDGGIGVIRTRLKSRNLRGSVAYQLHEGLGGLPPEIGLVIIDTKALLTHPEAATMSDQVDGVFLVTSAKHTTIDETRRALAIVQEAGGQVIGAIVNRRSFRLPASVSNFLGVSVPVLPKLTGRAVARLEKQAALPDLSHLPPERAAPEAARRKPARSGAPTMAAPIISLS